MTDGSAPRLTSPRKVIWPAVGATKADLWRYLESVARRMLPQVSGRPLSLLRCPNGVEAEGFLQKNLPEAAPGWLPRHAQWTPTSRRTVAYALAEKADDLRWMANQAAVELHEMLVRADRDDRPDLLVFDLDPGEQGPRAPQAAHWLREVLDELGLEAAIKTSGKRGLHLVVPIQRRYEFFQARAFGLAAARACADRHPDALTVAMRKADRNGRLLLDWSRNGAAQTMVAPWSPRATPTATVSMPLRWDEVADNLDPSAFTIASALRRPDPWEHLPPAKRLERATAFLERAGYELADASPRSRVR
ncbi:MAG: ATP-dependent DNA ligase [Nitriliruptorales bacterium]|nr:ATP-dependent DNA ligase [Nitriliruptorales bacterium]